MLAQIESVPVGPTLFYGNSQPVNPIKITSTSLSSNNSNGVVVIDASQAHAGETATVSVTASDATNSTQAQRSFQVTVQPYAGSTAAANLATVNFKPYALPITATTPSGSPVSVQLDGQGTFPIPPATVSSYAIVQAPKHGTISNFNATMGTFTYTPAAGFTGNDAFSYSATSNGPNAQRLRPRATPPR